jgi:hypothetical protein
MAVRLSRKNPKQLKAMSQQRMRLARSSLSRVQGVLFAHVTRVALLRPSHTARIAPRSMTASAMLQSSGVCDTKYSRS